MVVFKWIYLTVTDYFSRYAWCRKMKTQTAANVTKAIKKYSGGDTNLS